MSQHYFTWLIGFVLLVSVGCDRGGGVPQVAKSTPAVEKSETASVDPMILDGYRKHDMQPGLQLHVWNLRLHGLKQFSASLLVIRDGEPYTAKNIEYQWEKWDDSEPQATGQILLVMQDGVAFGAGDKRVPLLSADFPKLPEGSATSTFSVYTIEGDLKPAISVLPSAGSLRSFPPEENHKAVLYAEIYVPSKDLANSSFFLAPNMDAIMKEARSGRTVIVVLLEWISH